MGKERESTLKGRDASTGQFIPVKEARERPKTTVVERVRFRERARASSSPPPGGADA